MSMMLDDLFRASVKCFPAFMSSNQSENKSSSTSYWSFVILDDVNVHSGCFRSLGDMTPDDPEDHVPTVQDSEVNLLKSGELT